jgi:hypothetical protein
MSTRAVENRRSTRLTPRISSETHEFMERRISADKYFEDVDEDDLRSAINELTRSSQRVANTAGALAVCTFLLYMVGTGMLLAAGRPVGVVALTSMAIVVVLALMILRLYVARRSSQK